MTEEGDGYQRVRRAFNILLVEHGDGDVLRRPVRRRLYVHRDHHGDPNARPPFVVVEPKKQREALALLEEEVFGAEPYRVPAGAVQPPGPVELVALGHAHRQTGPTTRSTR